MSISTNLTPFWKKYKEYSPPEEGPLRFTSIIVVNKTPTYGSINEGDFIQVIYRRKPMWVLFKCPCGCQTVISLSLQKVHNPHWRLKKTNKGRPSLYPSIWQKTGCRSHFWITNGYVSWAKFIGEY